MIRFEKAIKNNSSLFTTFKTEGSDKTIDDVFCIRTKRVLDSYRKISLNGLDFRVPNGKPRHSVDLKMIPNEKTGNVKIRFWQDNIFLGEQMEKLEKLPIVRF